MTDMPRVGFLCSGKNPLSLSVSIHCAGKLMELFRENGYITGAYHTVITEPLTKANIKRAEDTLRHMCGCCELVVTVGGCGFGVSDIMPDITDRLYNMEIPYLTAVLRGERGICEYNSEKMKTTVKKSVIKLTKSYDENVLKIVPSRAKSGVFEGGMIINLSGEYAEASRVLTDILPALSFVVYNVSGKSSQYTKELRNFLNLSIEFHQIFKK